jgi:L-ascorbate metabolism protein UlaG (beta-lactamase superfamily)
MIITYLGLQAFKIQFGETVIAFNPPSKDSKQKSARFGADIALVSLNDKDFNGVENVTHGDRAPFAITGPGEYEIKGIFIKGFKSQSRYGLKEGSKDARINTIYSISLEGMNICFLGALDSKDLTPETKEALDDIDILFVPIGGEGVLSATAGYELAVKLEPRLIIPMHYDGATDKNLKIFLKEAGEEGTKPIDKLTLKKKDLDGKEGEVVVLAPTA